MESEIIALLTLLGVIVTAIATGFAGYVAVRRWMFEMSPKGKLSFHKVLLRQEVSTADNKPLPVINIGFQVRNEAMFPIEFEIEKMSTSLMGRYPSSKEYAKKNFVAPVGGIGFFQDHKIDLGNTQAQNRTLQGLMIVRLKYGRLGKLTEELVINKETSLSFDENLKVIAYEAFDV